MIGAQRVVLIVLGFVGVWGLAGAATFLISVLFGIPATLTPLVTSVLGLAGSAAFYCWHERQDALERGRAGR